MSTRQHFIWSRLDTRLSGVTSLFTLRLCCNMKSDTVRRWCRPLEQSLPGTRSFRGPEAWIFSSTFPLEIRKWPTYTFSLWSLFISVGGLSITAFFVPPLGARRMEQISFACSELYYLWSTPHYLNGDSVCVCVCVCVCVFNGKQAVRIKIDVQQSSIVVYSTASSYGLH